MAKPRSTKLIEIDLNSYVEQRISELGLPTTMDDIEASADTFKETIEWVNNEANALLVLGASALFLAGGTALIARSPLSFLDIGLMILAVGMAFVFFMFGFRRRSWSQYLGKWGLKPVHCEVQSAIDDILDEVDSGNHTIMRIAASGTGTTATPISHRPVDLVHGKGCLANPWLVAELFGRSNSSREFVAITPEATGVWFNFYLWNPPVAAHLPDLFDRTPEIYAGEKIKRIKVRTALREIADYVATQKQSGKPTTRKDLVVSAFEKALKIEAARLRTAGEIDDLEERQLCRMNITGEAPSNDPAETSGNRGRKPESWFLNLMSGQYAPVTRPLSETIRNELNVLPGFVA